MVVVELGQPEGLSGGLDVLVIGLQKSMPSPLLAVATEICETTDSHCVIVAAVIGVRLHEVRQPASVYASKARVQGSETYVLDQHAISRLMIPWPAMIFRWVVECWLVVLEIE